MQGDWQMSALMCRALHTGKLAEDYKRLLEWHWIKKQALKGLRPVVLNRSYKYDTLAGFWETSVFCAVKVSC